MAITLTVAATHGFQLVAVLLLAGMAASRWRTVPPMVVPVPL